MGDTWRQCTPRCRSKNHATWLMSAITKSSSEVENILCLSRCYNAGLVSDELGHTVLHIAAAYGRKKAVEFLCANFRVNVNSKDASSGWTPLHLAMYHGNIDIAIALMLAGADLYMKDFNCQTPLDILKSDVRPYVMVSDEADIFTWGQNSSYTLGLANGQSRSSPEVLPLWTCEVGNVDQQRRLLSISDVVMTKYTSFYLTTNGRVFACGSGRGGRLGLGSEQTVLAPLPVQTLSSKQIVSISANVNHVAFVTSEGQLFVAGTNDHQQLGLGQNCPKELAPKIVRFKKDTKIKVVACGRFHTAVMSDRELFACGLNAGQLGLLKDTPYQAEFKLVTAVAATARDSQNTSFLALLACSDSATVVKTCAGDVLALTSYVCKKIASNCPGITQIAVTGGRLDHTAAPEILRAEKGSDLTVLMLIGEVGQVLVWREHAQTNQGGILRELRCTGLGRDLTASWIWAPTTANDGRILMCTTDGNAFIVTLAPSSQLSGAKDKSKSSKAEWSAFHVADRGRTSGVFRVCSYELASSTVRIKHIHRAIRIVTDPILANFACIQSRAETSMSELPVGSQPTSDLMSDLSKLYETTSSVYDSGTDVELVFGSNVCLYAHRAVLASMSTHFRRLFLASASSGTGMVSQRLRISVPDCEESEFRPLLKFAYTCLVDLRSYLVADESRKSGTHSTNVKVSPTNGNVSTGKKKKNSPKSKQSPQQNQQQQQQQQSHLSEAAVVNAQLLGRLAELSKRFGMGGNTLFTELEALRTSVASGRTYATSFRSSAKLAIDRLTLEDIADVWLRSTDGREFAAHRCVLSCRSDYFESMLAVGRWAEAGRAVVSQPVDGDVLELALTYIYSDWLGEVTDWKVLCKLLVYADQVFLSGLKSVAEMQLSMSPRLNISNCCQLIDFAHAYRAEILLPAATRFAITNMPCLLETHFSSISSIDDDALTNLATSFARLVTPAYRYIKPWVSMAPTTEDISSIVDDATRCRLLTDDDIDTLLQNMNDLFAESKEQHSGNNSNVSAGLIARVPGRHRRTRRRSNNSESSDGGSGGSGSGSGPIFVATNPPLSPLNLAPLSPSVATKTGPMSPGISGRCTPGGNSFQEVLNPLLSSKRSTGWNEPTTPTRSNGDQSTQKDNDVVSLAVIMADEKRQQENDRGVRIKSKPRFVQLPSLSCGVAASPPTGNSLQILATSPSNGRPAPASPSSFRGWGSVSSSSPLPTSPMPILADILRQEQQRTENTRRQDRRSLHQIQLEERAIDELTKLYADLETHGIAVTVERLSSAVGVSAPTWVARSAPVQVMTSNNTSNNVNNFPTLSSTVPVSYSSHR